MRPLRYDQPETLTHGYYPHIDLMPVPTRDRGPGAISSEDFPS